MAVTGQDIFLIAFLAFLEGLLSIDNAVILAMIAKPLPREERRKALSYGLLGAIVFRLLVLALAIRLVRSRAIKLVGGAYLLYTAGRHFLRRGGGEGAPAAQPRGFWRTVLAIEAMDLAFAADSILAAVALTPKLWVVFTGGMIGVVVLRFMATLFLRVLEKWPNFENSAFLLVGGIGIKVVIEGLELPGIDFHSARNPAFWIFWSVMLLALLTGFRRK